MKLSICQSFVEFFDHNILFLICLVLVGPEEIIVELERSALHILNLSIPYSFKHLLQGLSLHGRLGIRLEDSVFKADNCGVEGLEHLLLPVDHWELLNKDTRLVEEEFGNLSC